MMQEFSSGVRLNNGKILTAKKISELTDYIINKFAEEKLSMEEAKIVLENALDTIRECSVVQKITNVS